MMQAVTLPLKILFRRLKLLRILLIVSLLINCCFFIHRHAKELERSLTKNCHQAEKGGTRKTTTVNNTAQTKETYVEGAVAVNLSKLAWHSQNVEELSVAHGGEVEVGGWWRPINHTDSPKIALIIPMRNREQQLKVFLWHTHPILQKQQLSYKIFVVEQIGDTMFNKGAIYNIGVSEILKMGDFDCFIFHDVDLLAENDQNRYDCVDTPRHLSVAVDTLKYKLPHDQIFGGVEALSKKQFLDINGFSNMFWGWGGEDDDLYTRITHKGYKLKRPPSMIGRYKMNNLAHYRSDGVNKENVKMYHNEKARIARIMKDGLNQVHKFNFTKAIIKDLMYTRISINLEKPGFS